MGLIYGQGPVQRKDVIDTWHHLADRREAKGDHEGAAQARRNADALDPVRRSGF